MLHPRILLFMILYYCKVSAVPPPINRPDLIQDNQDNPNKRIRVDSSDVEPVERSGAWFLDGETLALVTRDPASPSRTQKTSRFSWISSAYHGVTGKKSGSNSDNESKNNSNNIKDRLKQFRSKSGRVFSSVGRSLSLSRSPQRQGSLQRKNSQLGRTRRQKTRAEKMGFSTDPHDSPGHPRRDGSTEGHRNCRIMCDRCQREYGTSRGSGDVPGRPVAVPVKCVSDCGMDSSKLIEEAGIVCNDPGQAEPVRDKISRGKQFLNILNNAGNAIECVVACGCPEEHGPAGLCLSACCCVCGSYCCWPFHD